MYSSPSNKPGISPDASKAFIFSKKAGPRTLLSSKIKQIFSYLTPALFMTSLRSLSKSITLYFLPALIWYTKRLFIQETNRVSVVFPTPEAPTRSKWPSGYLNTLSILKICSKTASNTTIGTSSCSSLKILSLATTYLTKISDKNYTLLVFNLFYFLSSSLSTDL